MEMLETAVVSGLVVAVQIGLPVLVLFFVGYLMYADTLRPWHRPPVGEEGPGGVASLAATIPCWQTRGCVAAAREACPAFHRVDLPCWKALKLRRGWLEPRCLECERFLSPPAGSRKDGERGM